MITILPSPGSVAPAASLTTLLSPDTLKGAAASDMGFRDWLLAIMCLRRNLLALRRHSMEFVG